MIISVKNNYLPEFVSLLYTLVYDDVHAVSQLELTSTQSLHTK